MIPWITSFLKSIILKWNLRLRVNNDVVLNKRMNRGVFQGDGLLPLIFVLCLVPLSKRLNGLYPKIEVSTRERNLPL